MCEPTSNSSPMFTRERFIIVLRRGVMNPDRQHASRTSFLSIAVYAIIRLLIP